MNWIIEPSQNWKLLRKTNGSNEIIVIIEVMIFPLQIVVYKYIIKYKIITRLEVFICHKQCRD